MKHDLSCVRQRHRGIANEDPKDAQLRGGNWIMNRRQASSARAYFGSAAVDTILSSSCVIGGIQNSFYARKLQVQRFRVKMAVEITDVPVMLVVEGVLAAGTATAETFVRTPSAFTNFLSAQQASIHEHHTMLTY